MIPRFVPIILICKKNLAVLQNFKKGVPIQSVILTKPTVGAKVTTPHTCIYIYPLKK